MKRLLMALCGVILSASLAWGVAGTATFTQTTYQGSNAPLIDGKNHKVTKCVWLITADASGDVVDPVLTISTGSPSPIATKYWGRILNIEVLPSAATAPTADYDVELRDVDDATIDFLGGLGDNCSETITKWGTPVDEVNGGPVYFTGKKLNIFGNNMGAAGIATLTIWIIQ